MKDEGEPPNKRARLIDVKRSNAPPATVIEGRIDAIHPHTTTNDMLKIVFRKPGGEHILQMKGDWSRQFEPHLSCGRIVRFELLNLKVIHKDQETPAGLLRSVYQTRGQCSLMTDAVRVEKHGNGDVVVTRFAEPPAPLVHAQRTALSAVEANERHLPTPKKPQVVAKVTSQPNERTLLAAALPRPASHELTADARPARAVAQNAPILPAVEDDHLPEVMIRDNIDHHNHGPTRKCTIAELPAIAKGVRNNDKTYIDVIGRLATWTVQPSRGFGGDTVLCFDIQSANADSTPLSTTLFLKAGVPVPELEPGCPIAVINMRWQCYAGKDQLFGPSKKWPFVCLLAYTSAGRRVSTGPIGEIHMDEAQLARINTRLSAIRSRGAFEETKTGGNPEAIAHELEKTPMTARTAAPAAPAIPKKLERVLRSSNGGSIYQERIVIIGECQHAINADILVEVRHWIDRDYMAANQRKRMLYVTDWSTDDRLVNPHADMRENHMNRLDKTDLQLSLVGNNLVSLLDESGIRSAMHHGECIVHFKRVYFSQKNGGPLDAIIRDYSTPKAKDPPFYIITAEEKESSSAYAALKSVGVVMPFMATPFLLKPVHAHHLQRSWYHKGRLEALKLKSKIPRELKEVSKISVRVLSSVVAPLPVQEVHTGVIHCDAVGLEPITLRDAKKLAIGQRARIDIRCNGFIPPIEELAQFRQLLCANCMYPEPIRALYSSCTNCYAEHSWTKRREPCCNKFWPAVCANFYPANRWRDWCDGELTLSYCFSLRVTDAQANASNINGKPRKLPLWGDEATNFLGIPANEITHSQLEKRLMRLIDGDPHLPLTVEQCTCNGSTTLRIVATKMH